MEVNYDPGVRPDAFHRFAVGVGGTSSTPKQIGQAWTHSGFSTAHYVLYMTQGGALCRGQASQVGIV
jgi:hypothetical protein